MGRKTRAALIATAIIGSILLALCLLAGMVILLKYLVAEKSVLVLGFLPLSAVLAYTWWAIYDSEL